MNTINVHLSHLGQWLLFRGLACHIMAQYGLTSDILGCEPWEFTESLDMSFDEIKNLPIELWDEVIERDVKELKADLIKQH